MKQTITLHSNSRKAIWEAKCIVEREGLKALENVGYYRNLVAQSFGPRVTEDAANDYRYHETVEALP